MVQTFPSVSMTLLQCYLTPHTVLLWKKIQINVDEHFVKMSLYLKNILMKLKKYSYEGNTTQEHVELGDAP